MSISFTVTAPVSSQTGGRPSIDKGADAIAYTQCYSQKILEIVDSFIVRNCMNSFLPSLLIMVTKNDSEVTTHLSRLLDE